MILKIGYTTGDKFDVNKPFVQMEQTTAVELYGVTSLETPTIIISNDIYNVEYNYCYLSEFNRYYYIHSVEFDGERVILHLNVDVWKSFATQLKNCYGHAVRSESEGINQITDNKMPFSDNIKVVAKRFTTTPFDTSEGTTQSANNCYVLVTSGG